MALSHLHRQPLRGVAASGSSRRQREGGYVLTIFGLLLVPLLLMAGLAVDVGYWYNRASDIQKAADAASLAGVVWLPDAAEAERVARLVAERNGFKHGDPGITVTATPSNKAPRRLKVTIRDTRVKSFFYKNLGGSNIGLTRTSFAEYITPVPMGSPRNFFGTGQLLRDYTTSPTAFESEELYMATNPYCSDREWGDRHQSRWVTTSNCTSGSSNDDYRSQGYELYIEAKPNRPGTIEVRLWDPRFNINGISVPTGAQNCTYTYPSSGTTGWTSVTTNRTLTGPLQYQTRINTTTNTWQTPIQVLGAGATANVLANRARYRAPSSTNCTPVMATEATIDNRRVSQNEDFTFSLYAADSTPLDDNDNPLICRETFSNGTAFESYSYLGSQRWNTLRVSATNRANCNITTAMRDGKYILRVKNNGAVGSNADGSNQWGIVAKYTNATGDGLCDGRTYDMCPRVYGKESISVRAAADTTEASFYLAEIAPEHVGKKLKIELFDPGEGGSYIEIRRPTGANTWTAVPFTWTSDGAGSGSGTQLSVTGNKFNGKLVTITVSLDGYAPPLNNNWWKIFYKFSGAVTDRTTWSAEIVGDPVHLIEEN